MKKTTIWAIAIMTCLCACNDKPKQSEATPASDATKTENTEAAANNAEESADVPPVVAACVNGLPLFAPFNGGDIIGEGRILKQSPEKYTKLILKETVLDVTYKEEKNKNLGEDGSSLNEYFFKSADKMKGQIYNYADQNAYEKYMKSHGDMTAEGEIIPMEYTTGVLASADYMQGRSVLKVSATTTEDPEGPEFPASVVSKVEKMLGQKVEKNRVAYVFGNDEYDFGIMQTKPNDKYGIAAWVIAKGNEVCLWTDTCEVVTEEGEKRVMWSNYAADEYNEPAILTVVKGKNGLDIYAEHMSTDEMVNYYQMRQKGDKMKRTAMGGFYIQYE